MTYATSAPKEFSPSVKKERQSTSRKYIPPRTLKVNLQKQKSGDEFMSAYDKVVSENKDEIRDLLNFKHGQKVRGFTTIFL